MLGLWLAVCGALPGTPQPFDGVDRAVEAAVQRGEIPGAVVLIGRRTEVLHRRAFGARALLPERRPMTVDTVFDLASLTKPFATTLAVMSLVERGLLELDAPVGRYVPELAQPRFAGVTIGRLLSHTSGLGPEPRDPAALAAAPFRAFARERLAYPPGSRFVYSDLGFILLGRLVESTSGRPLDALLEELLAPLGVAETTFHPPAELTPRIAPTEPVGGCMLQGVAHDAVARGLGGVAGHAGLFSTADDLARIVGALLETDGPLLLATTVRRMWTPLPEAGGQRALGWDASSPYAEPFVRSFPPGSVGHTGFTGTSIWLDPASGSYVILLTSRVHPHGGGAEAIRALRERVTAAAAAALFGQPSAPGI
jgi:CubicO group peptidase (beta-lactamase class C family)